MRGARQPLRAAGALLGLGGQGVGVDGGGHVARGELLAGAGTPRANDAMAAIVKKPATAQCIARAGALA